MGYIIIRENGLEIGHGNGMRAFFFGEGGRGTRMSI